MAQVPLKGITANPDRPLPRYSVCDIESMQWTIFLMIGLYFVIYDDDEKPIDKIYHQFNSLSEFLDFCFSSDHPYNDIYAHFGGKFDFSFIIGEAFNNQENYRIHDMVPRGSGLLCMSISKIKRASEMPASGEYLEKSKDGFYLVAERTITFRDSSAMLPFSLASITENFGVEHKKMDIDHTKVTGLTPDLELYAKYDHIGLHESLEKYFSWPIIREAGHANTIASQALKVFRTQMKEPIQSLASFVDEFVRQSYFGGRTEIFKPFFQQARDNEMLRSYDVNSLYPAVMREFEYPTKFKFETKFYMENQMGFYDVEVTVPDMYVPVLGVRFGGMEDRLIFPTGTFRGVWSTIELNYAIEQGAKINKIYRGMIFGSGGFIFKNYIERLYDIRKKSKKNSVDNVLCKLLMNSSYGRFGLNLEREKLAFDYGQAGVMPHMEIPDPKNPGNIIRLVSEEITLDTSFSNVAIASWVTAQARIWMHKLYSQAPEHLYYTDSVTENRMVMVMDRDGLISVMSMKELWEESEDKKYCVSNKERADLNKWTLSYNAINQTMEWRRIEKIIRHKVNKKIVEARSNKGASVTTTDHSYIDQFNNKVKPEQLLSHFSPKKLKITKGKIIDEIDLWDYLEDKSGLEVDDLWIWALASPKSKKSYKKVKIRRHYSGNLLKDFCLLAGYYVAEGSASTSGRFMFSISSEKIEFQETLKEILQQITTANISHIKSSKKDNCFALRSGTKTLAIVFGRLFGQGSAKKRLPNFVFNLNYECHNAIMSTLILGDGSKCFSDVYSEEYKENNFSYSTNSFVLLNQLCALLALEGQCYSVQYRKSKKNWNIQTSYNNRDKKPVISEVNYDGFVYDLQVEKNNNFFDCEGLIGLHNTDSMKSTFVYPRNDADLGKLKLEYKAKQAAFLLPKTYIEDTNDPSFNIYDEIGNLVKDKKTNKKIVMKGFDKKKIQHFTFEDFTSALEGDMKRLAATNPKKFATLRTAVKHGTFLKLLDEEPRQIRTRYNKRRIFKRRYAQVYDSEPLVIKNDEIVNMDKEILKKWKMPTYEEMDETIKEMGL